MTKPVRPRKMKMPPMTVFHSSDFCFISGKVWLNVRRYTRREQSTADATGQEEGSRNVYTSLFRARVCATKTCTYHLNKQDEVTEFKSSVGIHPLPVRSFCCQYRRRINPAFQLLILSLYTSTHVGIHLFLFLFFWKTKRTTSSVEFSVFRLQFRWKVWSEVSLRSGFGSLWSRLL